MNRIAINQAIAPMSMISAEYHDGINGRVFPIKYKPWLDYSEYSKISNTFTTAPFIFYAGENELTVVDKTNYFDFLPPILSTGENAVKEFYYKNKSIYTNFDIIEELETITIKYKVRSDTVSLEIDLIEPTTTTTPLIDSFELQLIGIEY